MCMPQKKFKQPSSVIYLSDPHDTRRDSALHNEDVLGDELSTTHGEPVLTETATPMGSRQILIVPVSDIYEFIPELVVEIDDGLNSNHENLHGLTRQPVVLEAKTSRRCIHDLIIFLGRMMFQFFLVTLSFLLIGLIWVSIKPHNESHRLCAWYRKSATVRNEKKIVHGYSVNGRTNSLEL